MANNRVRKVTPAGSITNVAGNGTPGYAGDGGAATAAELYGPLKVSLDTSGNLYIVDLGSQCIRKVTSSSGIITTVAGNGKAGFSGDGGAATSASLNNPTGMVVDGAGNLYVADYLNGRVRKVDTRGIITTVAGNGPGFAGDGGDALSAPTAPFAIAVDAAGSLYIADKDNNRIRKVTY